MDISKIKIEDEVYTIKDETARSAGFLESFGYISNPKVEVTADSNGAPIIQITGLESYYGYVLDTQGNSIHYEKVSGVSQQMVSSYIYAFCLNTSDKIIECVVSNPVQQFAEKLTNCFLIARYSSKYTVEIIYAAKNVTFNVADDCKIIGDMYNYLPLTGGTVTGDLTVDGNLTTDNLFADRTETSSLIVTSGSEQTRISGNKITAETYNGATREIYIGSATKPVYIGDDVDNNIRVENGNMYFKNKKYIYFTDSEGIEYPALVNNATNLWIGALQTASRHHAGGTYISSGYNTSTGKGYESIRIAVPNDTNDNGSSYYAIHTGNLDSQIAAKKTYRATVSKTSGTFTITVPTGASMSGVLPILDYIHITGIGSYSTETGYISLSSTTSVSLNQITGSHFSSYFTASVSGSANGTATIKITLSSNTKFAQVEYTAGITTVS